MVTWVLSLASLNLRLSLVNSRDGGLQDCGEKGRRWKNLKPNADESACLADVFLAVRPFNFNFNFIPT